MTRRYIYKDPIFNRPNTRNPYLKIESENPILNIFRLISGTIDCIDQYKNKVYKFRINFSDFPFTLNDKINQASILSNFPEEVRLKNLNKYFHRSRFNSAFYKSIEAELIKCLIAEKENNHLEAFFYLYRIIEGISYSVPLIYASKNKNYNKTYKQLQSFFLGKEDGELIFFRRFISETFRDEDFFNSTIDIDFSLIDVEELRKKYFTIYLQKLPNKPGILMDSNENQDIKISFIGFYDFIIALRNRFFHNTKGSWNANLSSTEVLFPDYFFKPVVNHGLNWVSLILFEIIKVDFEKGIN